MSKTPTDSCACRFTPITRDNNKTWEADRRANTRHATDHCCAGFCPVCSTHRLDCDLDEDCTCPPSK